MREIRYNHVPGKVPPTLESVPFLQGLDSNIVDKVLADSILLECDKGDVIITEGDTSRFFCILLKGAVDIQKGGKSVARVDGAGEMLGELALLSDHARSATVIADNHVYCLKVEPTFLERFKDADRNAFYAMLFRFVAQILGERLEQSDKRVAQLEAKHGKLTGGVPESEDDVYRL